jgi:hypothetical protein
MIFIDKESGLFYRLLSKEEGVVFLEATDHSIYPFDQEYFDLNFEQVKVKKNASN